MSSRPGFPAVLAVVSLKGGSGKSVTAANLGAVAVERGYSTILVDADPSAGLAYALGCEPAAVVAEGKTLHAALAAGTDRARIEAQLLRTVDGAELLAGTATLFSDEARAKTTIPRLVAVLRELADVVIIDSPPSFSGLTQGASLAADAILVTTLLEPLSTMTLPLVFELAEALGISRDRIAGIIPSMVTDRLALSRDQLGELERLADSVPILESIPRATLVAAATLAGRPIVAVAPNATASIAFRKLADALGYRPNRAPARR